MKKFILLIFLASSAQAGGLFFKHKDTVIQQEFENVYQSIFDLQGRIPLFNGLDTDTNHTSDVKYTGYCLGGNVLCVDTNPSPYGYRVMIGTSTSLRHAGLTVNYDLNKPSILLDNQAGFGTGIQGRGYSNNAQWFIGNQGIWDADSSRIVAFASYDVPLNFNVLGSTIPTVQIGSTPVYNCGMSVRETRSGVATAIFDNAGSPGAALSFRSSNLAVGDIGSSGFWKNDASSNFFISARAGKTVEVYANNQSTMTLEIAASSVTSFGRFFGKGGTDGTSPPAGYVGEIISTKTATNVNVGTNNQYFDIVSTGIAPGHWLLIGQVTYFVNSATFLSADLELGISSTAGNSATGLVAGDNYDYFTDSTILGTSGAFPVAVPVWEVNPTAQTTYYLKGFVGNYNAGSPQCRGKLVAQRIP